MSDTNDHNNTPAQDDGEAPIVVSGPVIPDVAVPVQRSPYSVEPPVRRKAPSPIDGLGTGAGPAPEPAPAEAAAESETPAGEAAETPAEATVEDAAETMIPCVDVDALIEEITGERPAPSPRGGFTEIPLTPELLPLVGAVTARDKHRKRSDDGEGGGSAEHSDALTAAVDGVSWAEWIAGDERVELTGQVDSCGCDVFHWRGSDTARSGILHDGCQFGYGAHVFSGTLEKEWGRDHASRLAFAAWLHGASETELRARHGLPTGNRLQAVDLGADGCEDAAVVAEERAQTAESEAERARWIAAAERHRERAAVLRDRMATAPAPTYRVAGGGSAAAAGDDDAAAAAAAGDDVEDDVSDEGDYIDEAEETAKGAADLRRRLAALPDPHEKALEDAVFDFLPQTRAIRDRARYTLVSPWSALIITIGRGLLRVSPSVVLPPVVGEHPAVLNLQAGIVGASGKGKDASAAVVDYKASIDHGWDRKFRPSTGAALAALYVTPTKDDDGNVVMEMVREAAWCDWSEIDTLTATGGRGGNDLASELRVAITGAELGSDTKKDQGRQVKVEPRSYRTFVSFSTQLGRPAAALAADTEGGTLQRTVWAAAADPLAPDADPPHVDRPILDVLMSMGPGEHQMTIDADVRAEIRADRRRHLRELVDDGTLHAHRNLTKLKIAAWASLVQMSASIGREEWVWAERVMTHSDRVFGQLSASVKGVKRRDAVERGRLDHVRRNAERNLAAEELKKLAASLDKTMRRLVAKGKYADGSFSLPQLRTEAGPGKRRDNLQALANVLCDDETWIYLGGDRYRTV